MGPGEVVPPRCVERPWPSQPGRLAPPKHGGVFARGGKRAARGAAAAPKPVRIQRSPKCTVAAGAWYAGPAAFGAR